VTKSPHPHKQISPSTRQNSYWLATKLFSRLENIFSKLGYLFSSLGYKFSSLENSFSSRNKLFITVYF
jgi:hypothetical protein